MPPEAEPTDADTIDLSDAEDDIDSPAPEPAAEPGVRPSKQARRNRYNELKTELEQEKTERQRLINEQAQMRQEMLQMRQMQMQGSQYQGDPIDSALEENFHQRQQLDEEFSLKKPTDPKVIQDMQRRAQVLEDQRTMLNTQKVMRSQPQPNPAVQAVESYASANHPEIVNDPKATLYARGIIQQKVAMGKELNLETIKEALEETERGLKIGRYRNGAGVDPGLTSRLAGHSRGAGANGGNGQVTSHINMNMQNGRYKAMADAAYPEIKDAQKRYEKWARGPGRRLVAAGVKLDE